jgi:hypothetical protein
VFTMWEGNDCPIPAHPGASYFLPGMLPGKASRGERVI